MHSAGAVRKTMIANQIIVLTTNEDERIVQERSHN